MYSGALLKSAMKVMLLQLLLVFVFTEIAFSKIKDSIPRITVGIHPVYRPGAIDI